MKYTIIFPFDDTESRTLIEDFLTRCHQESTFYFITTDQTYDKCYSRKNDHIEWINKDGWNEFISEVNHDCFTRNLSEEFHLLSDSLLYSGEPMKLYCILPDDFSENSLELYGVFYRMKKWHNIDLTFITTSDSLSQSVIEFTEFLSTDIVDEFKYDILDHQTLWMGKISVLDKVDDKGFQFPGFRLSSNNINKLKCRYNNKDIQYGRMIEILDVVDMSTVPTFLMTNITLQLDLVKDCKESRIFVEDLNSRDKEEIYIGRLATYDTKNIPTCGMTNHLKTSAWKDKIMTDISCIQEPDEEILSGLQYVHFMLTSDRCSDILTLTVLISARDINSNIINILETVVDIEKDTTDDVCDNKFVSSLPCIDRLDLTLLHDHLNQLQCSLLKDWIEEQNKKNLNTIIDKKQLQVFLEKTQQLFLQSIFDNYIDEEHDKECSEDDTEVESMEPSKWPERLALQYEESKQKTMKRYRSSDSIPLSSPFYPCPQESSTSLDAIEFLRFFQPDGSALNPNLSPVRKKPNGRTIRRLSSHESLTSWPECKSVKYHDIYYYSKKDDIEFARIRDRLMKNETNCSLYSSAYSKAQLKIQTEKNKLVRSISGHILSPTRRSPRGKKRKQTFEGVPSSSQPSKMARNNTARTPTKMAQRHLKSPRKLHSLQSPRKRVNLHARRSSPRKNVKKSPRKPVTASRSSSTGTCELIKLPPPCVYDEDSNFGTTTSTASTIEVRKKPQDSDKEKMSKAQESRSQRHRRKLEEICSAVLGLNGVDKSNPIFKSCSSNLYQVTKFFVKALPNAHSLSQEMRRIAEGQVQQVIDLEKRRQELSQKKKSIQN